MIDPTLIIKKLDSKAGGLNATIVNVTGYPNIEEMCPGSTSSTFENYVKPTHALVDWHFSNDGCSTPCECLPTKNITDCSQTEKYDCVNFPLRTDEPHFSDCNSIHVHNGNSCWEINDSD